MQFTFVIFQIEWIFFGPKVHTATPNITNSGIIYRDLKAKRAEMFVLDEVDGILIQHTDVSTLECVSGGKKR